MTTHTIPVTERRADGREVTIGFQLMFNTGDPSGTYTATIDLGDLEDRPGAVARLSAGRIGAPDRPTPPEPPEAVPHCLDEAAALEACEPDGPGVVWHDGLAGYRYRAVEIAGPCCDEPDACDDCAPAHDAARAEAALEDDPGDTVGRFASTIDSIVGVYGQSLAADEITPDDMRVALNGAIGRALERYDVDRAAHRARQARSLARTFLEANAVELLLERAVASRAYLEATIGGPYQTTTVDAMLERGDLVQEGPRIALAADARRLRAVCGNLRTAARVPRRELIRILHSPPDRVN